jgi:hypothetical protein
MALQEVEKAVKKCGRTGKCGSTGSETCVTALEYRHAFVHFQNGIFVQGAQYR